MYEEVIIVSIVFTSIIALAIVIGVVIYFAKRLEHKQILAAIEKGIPPSELRAPKPKPADSQWIKYLTHGIVILAVACAFVLSGLPGPRGPMIFVAAILCGVGIAWMIRGLFYRKYQHQIQASDKNNTTENKNREISS